MSEYKVGQFVRIKNNLCLHGTVGKITKLYTKEYYKPHADLIFNRKDIEGHEESDKGEIFGWEEEEFEPWHPKAIIT